MTSPVICFGQQPCGFFPKRFLASKFHTARRLQSEIGGDERRLHLPRCSFVKLDAARRHRMRELAPDLILTAARITTMDPAMPEVTALAVKDGEILAVGDQARVEALAGPATRVIRLNGRRVIPGLNDTHNHLLSTGAVLTEVQLYDARSIEEIKVAVGSADPTPDESHAEVRGRDLVSGLPRVIVLSPEEVRGAIEEVVSSIIESVIRCLAKAPPELSQDFLVRGVNLVGGGGMLRGLDQRLSRETKVPVELVDAPLECVVLGAGHCIEHYDALKGIFMGARR